MKKMLLTLTALSLTLTLTSCKSAKDMVTATSEPMSTASATPNVTTVQPGATNGLMDGMMDDAMDGTNGMDGILPNSTVIPESTGVTTMDKAKRVIEQIEDELERLSEVDDAEVVLAGNRAVVGLEFDDQYQGGIDERLRGIVRERIAGVISGVTDIVITADAAIMDEIETLGDRLKTMSDMSALQSDLDAIVRKISGT